MLIVRGWRHRWAARAPRLPRGTCAQHHPAALAPHRDPAKPGLGACSPLKSATCLFCLPAWHALIVKGFEGLVRLLRACVASSSFTPLQHTSLTVLAPRLPCPQLLSEALAEVASLEEANNQLRQQ